MNNPGQGPAGLRFVLLRRREIEAIFWIVRGETWLVYRKEHGNGRKASAVN